MKYYTVEEVAEMLEMHPKTIQKYIREGKIKANKVGKRWLVTGHDLSLFTEGDSTEVQEFSLLNQKTTSNKASASTVVDLSNIDQEEAMRISRMLTAILNNKEPQFGKTTIKVKYIEQDLILRVMVWGSLKFTEYTLASLSEIVD